MTILLTCWGINFTYEKQFQLPSLSLFFWKGCSGLDYWFRFWAWVYRSAKKHVNSTYISVASAISQNTLDIIQRTWLKLALWWNAERNWKNWNRNTFIFSQWWLWKELGCKPRISNSCDKSCFSGNTENCVGWWRESWNIWQSTELEHNDNPEKFEPISNSVCNQLDLMQRCR